MSLLKMRKTDPAEWAAKWVGTPSRYVVNIISFVAAGVLVYLSLLFGWQFFGALALLLPMYAVALLVALRRLLVRYRELERKAGR